MILGIVGRSGSGKSTMAGYLVRTKRYTAINLADPLKRFCKEIYGFTDNQLWGPSADRNAPDQRFPREDGSFLTPREALQTLGTEWGRACYEDTWVDYCMNASFKILGGQLYDSISGFNSPWIDKIMKKHSEGVVIGDVRFKNEVSKLRESGAKIIKLNSPWAPTLTAGVEGHASEKFDIPDDLVDHVIEVPKGLPAFYAEIDVLLERLK